MNNPLNPPPAPLAAPAVAPTTPPAAPHPAAPFPQSNIPQAPFPASPFPQTDIPSAAPAVEAVSDIDMPDAGEVAVRDFTTFDSKLAVIGGDPNLDYRWVNSDMQRYSKLYSEGYRPVKNKARARSEVHGSDGPELFAGTQSDGASRKAILMARHKKFRVNRDETYRQLIQNNQRSLDPTRFQGNKGADSDSFTGAINISGGSNS